MALYCYEPPLTFVIHALKFRRLDFLARDLGPLLARELPDEAVNESDLIIPIPLSRLRLLRRGFNQAAVLAEALGEALDLPVRRLLRRSTRSPQARLSRSDRLRNLRGSFSCRRPVRGLQVLLVDDVLTTGTTLEAAARCLVRAGARVSLAAVAGRTRRHLRTSPGMEGVS
ncbi:MAG: phosphoribosyltransferase family protein [Thermoanaerobaculia bacterium]|nr:phosphoribosyltransferase family protein [Thermoanaerobaculia bacterium]